MKALSIGLIFSVGIGVYFLSALIPGALNNFFGANTTDWDAGTVALWGLIPLAIIAGIVLFFIPSSNE